MRLFSFAIVAAIALLTLDAPDTTLVMLPGEPDYREVTFSTDRDPSTERVTGRIQSVDAMKKATGVPEALSARRVDAFVDAVFQGTGFGDRGPSAYYRPPPAPAFLSAFRAGRAEVCEVHATIEFTFRNLGACCWAFPSIVAAGRNATTLHRTLDGHAPLTRRA